LRFLSGSTIFLGGRKKALFWISKFLGFPDPDSLVKGKSNMQKNSLKHYFLLAFRSSLTKRAGAGSVSHTYQNVTDPEHEKEEKMS
jgi:hypothetical protein